MEKRLLQSSCICKETTTIRLNGKSHIWITKKTGKKGEALYINSMDPKHLMNLEKGFEINKCWNQFNPQIRNITLKKGK